MGGIVQSEVEAVGLVYGLTDRADMICAACVPKECQLPEPGRCVKHLYEETVPLWIGKDETEFLSATSWEIYSIPRWMEIFRIQESSVRYLAREFRSRTVFDSGRDVHCEWCGSRIFAHRTTEKATCLVEYHGVKIF